MNDTVFDLPYDNKDLTVAIKTVFIRVDNESISTGQLFNAVIDVSYGGFPDNGPFTTKTFIVGPVQYSYDITDFSQ